MNSTHYKKHIVYSVLDRTEYDCCTHVEVPSMQSILQFLVRSGSLPPSVEMIFPESHTTDDTFDTDISYRNPSLKDLNKQYYAMKSVSADFNVAVSSAVEASKSSSDTTN